MLINLEECLAVYMADNHFREEYHKLYHPIEKLKENIYTKSSFIWMYILIITLLMLYLYGWNVKFSYLLGVYSLVINKYYYKILIILLTLPTFNLIHFPMYFLLFYILVSFSTEFFIFLFVKNIMNFLN